MVATLIIIRGNSASGKSTIAKQLQAELGENTLLLSQDYLRREMLGTKGKYYYHSPFDQFTKLWLP